MNRLRGQVSRVAIAVLAIACVGGERTLVEPPRTEVMDLTLTIAAETEDAAVAQQLGFTDGIPAAEISIVSTSGGPSQTYVADDEGVVAIADMKVGSYRVSARRLFTDVERLTASQAGSAVAFVGEAVLDVQSGVPNATVRIPASYRRSLVISEWSFQHLFVPGLGSYRFSGFLELYNNGDTTVYLDGTLIADAFGKEFDNATQPCSMIESYSTDPAGIWARRLAAFPGSGRDYSLAPGEAVVVATDAIDHRGISAAGIDLRGADFEFLGFEDVDNPAVPNLPEVGLAPDVFAHGLSFANGLRTVSVLAAPGTPSAFPTAAFPPNALEYARVPGESILDVFSSVSTWHSLQQPPNTLCPRMTSPVFDREYGIFTEENAYDVSLSRRVLMTLPDGKRVLQHTRTSAFDFEKTPRTPGLVGQ